MEAKFISISPTPHRYLIEVDEGMLNQLGTSSGEFDRLFNPGDAIKLHPHTINMIENAAVVDRLDKIMESFERRRKTDQRQAA